MSNRLRFFVVCVFGAWLLAPLFLLIVPLKFCAPVDENRKMHDLPAWSTIRNPAGFIDTVNGTFAWFEDHFGARDLMIRCKNQIDFTLFAKSDKVHVGAGGWLFLRNPLDSYIVYLERQPTTIIDDKVKEMEVLAQYLDTRGIKLIVMVVPLKWTVYSESLPSSAPRLPDLPLRHCTYWKKKLKESHAFTTFDPLDILQGMKSETDSFYRTDYHWSQVAALRVSKELLRIAVQITDSPVSSTQFNEEFQVETLMGDSSRYLPIWRQPTEEALFFKSKEPYPPQDVELPYQMVFRNSGRELLPTAVILGDSFFWNIYFSGFQRHFKELYFGHIQRPSRMDILRQPPKNTRVVILELLEANYPIDFHL